MTMSLNLRATVLALGLACAATVLAARTAVADTIDPFVGSYVGTAQVLGPDGEVTEERDMDITITKETGGGFRIVWINVTLIDGRRDVPGVRRRVDEAKQGEAGHRLAGAGGLHLHHRD